MKLSRKIIASSLMCLALAIPVFANIYNNNASQTERLEAKGTEVTWTAENQAHTGSTITNPMVFGDEECPVSGSFDRGTNPDRKPAWNGSPSSHVRMYPDNTMTITLQEGFVFESIMITSEIFGSYDDAHFEYTTNDGFEWNTVVGDGWEAGDCTSREIVFQMRSEHTSEQIRVSSITVTYSSPALPTMLRDILPVDFPKDKENGWTNGNSKLYADSTSLYLDDAGILPLDVILMPNDGNFAYIDAPNNHFYSFYMNDDSLVKINLLGFPSSQNGDYALKQVTIGDILPDDFPIYYGLSIPDNAWKNDSGTQLMLFSKQFFYFITENEHYYCKTSTNEVTLTKEGENLSFTCKDNVKYTFVMLSNKLIKIIVSNSGIEGCDGEYRAPLSDSLLDFNIDFGEDSIACTLEQGIISLIFKKGYYEMNLELYTDPSATEILAGTYVLSDSEEISTALSSTAIEDNTLNKSYAVLKDNDEKIIECWLLAEGAVTISYDGNMKVMNVLVDAKNTKGKDIKASGSCEPHFKHVLLETHEKVEAKCLEAGHEAYYECTCGKYFSDQAMSAEITNLTAWLAKDGEGYIAPLGHDFTKEVKYEWNADHSKCTATAKCSHTGCNETLTETANGIYVKDFDATCSANEKGHYEATFQNAAFTKRETLMMDKENTATGHDFVITYTWNEDNTACTAHAECSKGDCSLTNEGTITVEDGYAVATFVDEEFETQRVKLPEPKPTPKQNSVNVGAIIGISVGSVVVLGITAYVVMFFVWKKSEKGLKFLISSFKWINNKIFKK